MKENLNKYIVDSVTPNEVISPKKIDDIIEIIQTSNQKNDKIIVWGSGTKISIGNIPEKLDIILKTERMNQVVEYIPENLTVTTNSGIKLKELQSELNKRGQFLPIDPFNSENATIGGIISSNSNGPLRQRYGSIRDLLLGIGSIQGEGKKLFFGGKVVKNVAGYDLKKLYVGSFGSLGIIHNAVFKVYPIPESKETIIIHFETVSDAMKFVSNVTSSFFIPSTLELMNSETFKLISNINQDKKNGVYLLSLFEGINSAVTRQIKDFKEIAIKKNGKEIYTLTTKDSSILWRNITTLSEISDINDYNTSIKMSIPYSNMLTVFDKISSFLKKTNLKNLMICHAGLGIIYLFIRTNQNQESNVKKIIQEIQKVCYSQNGDLIILNTSLTIKKELDVFGQPQTNFYLMKGIKNIFDPNKIFSPGRFLGKI